MFKKIAIFGVGLIGGSFARALRHAGAVEQIVGVGRSPASVARARDLAIVDLACSDTAQAVRGADLVLIATPVAQMGAILSAIKPHLGPDAIVTDAGSTKGDVVAAARVALGEKISQFVPGHPIAGRELNGPDAAIADLYVGKKVVLTPLVENRKSDVDRVAHAWQLCGASIHHLTPEQHDAVFAAVSHLPHVLAFALVDEIAKRADADVLFQYAASGFRDFTRIAASSPEMWRDISLANRPALLRELDAYLEQLTRLRAALFEGNAAALEAVYANARQARQDWGRTIEVAEAQAQSGEEQPGK